MYIIELCFFILFYFYFCVTTKVNLIMEGVNMSDYAHTRPYIYIYI